MDEAIREVLGSDPHIAYALLFGSEAAGRATVHSDLDIAIASSSGEGFDHHTLGSLTASLERTANRPVHVVVLDQAPPALAYRVFRDGRLLVERDAAALTRDRARAILGYLDFKPVEQLCARAILESAAHGR
jgi:uncharacterized protein